MTSTPSELVVLALNSGSSSLKFGLYRVSASRTDTLFSGVAEAIGEPSSQFQVRDFARKSADVHDSASILSQRDAIIRIGKLLEEDRNARTGRDRAPCRAWRPEAAAALPD